MGEGTEYTPKEVGSYRAWEASVLPGGKPIYTQQLQDSKSQNRPVCSRLEEMKGLTSEKNFPVTSSPEYPPPPVPGFIPDYPTPRPLWLGWLRPAARDLSGTHNHPLPSWGPSGKACPPRQRRICPSLAGRPCAAPGLGARAGAAGAGPGYL